MNDRKKLIMLLGDDTCHRECSECEYHENEKACIRHLKESMADHLLANGVTVQKWIPVTDRLPERDEKCLCRYTFGEKEVMCFYQVLDYYASDPQPHFRHTLGDSKMRVTHWMPLPEPPDMSNAKMTKENENHG